MYLKRETNLFDGQTKRMLHIAPEPCLGPRISSCKGVEYVSGDLESGRAMTVVDVTNIQFADCSFDVIYCSHVLEHVPDDAKAMSEFVRVLRPNGWAILQVPIFGERTDEDSSVVDPDERHRRFGQWDHVRSYGRDYRDRLGNAGFVVREIPYARQMGPKKIRKYGLDVNEFIYFCTKRA
jgi:ubiquinone/menaquinone biosynthesis C-methylase UbiE